MITMMQLIELLSRCPGDAPSSAATRPVPTTSLRRGSLISTSA
jgi:hypothetical protein